MGKISSVFLIFTVFLVAELLVCCSGEEANATFGCILRERNALLRFKASLSDPSDRLSSWNASTDCCQWQGIMCDETSGNVIGLDLQNQRYGNFFSPSPTYMLHSGTLHSSLLDLKHLSFLDLSGNDFHQASIPSFLGSMNLIQHLNLSHANFSGVVPHHLGNLSLLSLLDLSYNGFQELIVDDFTWVSHLSFLKYLDMSWVDLSQTEDLLEVLNMLPFLVDIRMSSSRLENRNLQHACVNSTLPHIEYLDLSRNLFHGDLPCFLQNMTSLRYLFLTYNNYDSCNQLHLVKLTNLVIIGLSYNLLPCNTDSIPELILGKPHLKDLSLVNNSFDGDVSKIFQNLSGHELEYLDLSLNNFYGQLPEEIDELSKLKTLDLSYNHISGPIPTSIGNLSALEDLYLSDNQVTGEIPIALGQLSNLKSLDLSDNSLNGTIFESHFSKLTKLNYLSISNNFIKLGVRSNWMPPFQLVMLEVQSCEIVGEFPQWIQTQKELKYLYMSNNSISGPLPYWLPYINMAYLDLSHNYIHGAIPDSLCQMKYLTVLDLSKNSLSGDLLGCWARLNMLVDLSLSSNSLSGAIPESIGGAYSLEWLQLSDNRFSGELPYTLINCTRLVVLDIGENSISGKLPGWIGNYLLNLRVLRLSNNKYHDKIPSNLCQLSQLQILDLANNMLTGKIPHCVGNLSGMLRMYNSIVDGISGSTEQSSVQLMTKGVARDYSSNLRYVVYLDLSNNSLIGEIPVELTRLSTLSFMNLSHNHLQGNIPQRIGDMNLLESLDLSNNYLSGKIPGSLTDLNFLSHLNLSHNNLTGEIPTGYQLQTLEDTSIYEGNPGLCGAQLPKKCNEGEPSNVPNAENHDAEDEDDEKAERIWFYGIVISGFATGFWGAIGVLLFKKGWRYVYFKFTDGIISRMLGVQ